MSNRHLCRICLFLILWFPLTSSIRGQAGVPVCPIPEKETVRVGGTVYRQEFRSTGQHIYLKDISFYPAAASGPDIKNWKKKKIIVYMEEEQRVSVGNYLCVEGICTYPQRQRNPGGFDAAAYYDALGIGMFVRKGAVLKNDGHIWPLRNAISETRLFLRRCLEKAGEDTDAGVLSAMLLGDRGGLDQGIKDLYQSAGIIHLLAISGLHISLTGMALYRFLRRIRLGFVSSTLTAGGLMAAYACMTGFPVSAVRAVVMFGLFLLSQVTGRTYDLPTGLAVTAAAMMIGSENVVRQPGFWLSFAAVAGVLLSSVWQSRLFKGSMMGVSLAVQIATLPIVCFCYFQFPLYAVLLNLLVLPLMPFILGFGIAGMAAAAFYAPLGTFVLAPAHYLLEGVALLCEQARLLPGALIVTGQPALWKVAAYYLLLAVLWQCFFRERSSRSAGKIRVASGGKRDIAVFGAAAALLAVVCLGNGSRAFLQTFLDVGQGDGCCIQNEGRSVWMIDGGSSSEKELAKYCLEPFLKQGGRRRVDYWMISHGDMDHVSGLLEILRAYERALDGTNAAGLSIGTILLSDAGRESEINREIRALAKKNGIAVRAVKKGDVIKDGRMTVRILAPDPAVTYENENASSVVAEIAYRSYKALLTGDVEGTGERALLKGGLLEDIDVLKAAHHGSKGTTSEAFLQAVRPEVTVISCGLSNSYGHPHDELLRRLANCKSRVARTDRQGALCVAVTAKGYAVSGYLAENGGK